MLIFVLFFKISFNFISKSSPNSKKLGNTEIDRQVVVDRVTPRNMWPGESFFLFVFVDVYGQK